MKLAVDVHYYQRDAIVAGVIFTDWQACKPEQEVVTTVSGVAKYEPGQFYKRELPCILALLKHVQPLPKYILIDGYVDLGRDRKPGLGRHLYNALNDRCAIVGVAKSRFEGTPAEAELFRGYSNRPLYITSAAITQSEAKRCIKAMCGEDRLPVLLKQVDQLCRGKS